VSDIKSPLYFFMSMVPGPRETEPHIGGQAGFDIRCEEHAPAEAKGTKLVDATYGKWARCTEYHADWRCQICNPEALR